MRAYIIYSDYDFIKEKTIVRLFGRMENGKSFCSINTITPYFFIKEESKKKAEKYLKKYQVEKTGLTDFKGNKVIKISHPSFDELQKLSKSLLSLEIET